MLSGATPAGGSGLMLSCLSGRRQGRDAVHAEADAVGLSGHMNERKFSQG